MLRDLAPACQEERWGGPELTWERVFLASRSYKPYGHSALLATDSDIKASLLNKVICETVKGTRTLSVRVEKPKWAGGVMQHSGLQA